MTHEGSSSSFLLGNTYVLQLIVNIDALLTKFISACHDAAKPSLMRSDRIEDDDDSRENFLVFKNLDLGVSNK